MNLFYVRYFVKLAEMGHYTKAAQELHITQPSLSHAISQLENELGVPLFEKNGRNTTLTRFGDEFLACARQTLMTLDGGVSSIQREARGDGVIRVGFLRALGIQFVPELAAEFMRRNDENEHNEINFTFHTGATKKLLEELAAKKYDIVFCSKPPEEYNFSCVAVEKQKLVLITPENHPLAGLESVELSQLVAYPMIYFTKESGMRDVVEQLFAAINEKPKMAYETEEDQVVAGLVAQGFGIAIVPYMELLHKLDVSIIQISSHSYSRDLYMVSNDQIYMPPAVRNFYEFVLDKHKRR